MKITFSVTARKPFVASGLKISPLTGYNTNIADKFEAFISTAVNKSKRTNTESYLCEFKENKS